MKTLIALAGLTLMLAAGTAEASTWFFNIRNRSQIPVRYHGVSCDYAESRDRSGSLNISTSAMPRMELIDVPHLWKNGHLKQLNIKSKVLSHFTVELEWVKGETSTIPMDAGTENQWSATLSLNTETGSGVLSLKDFPTQGQNQVRPLKNCTGLDAAEIDMTGAWISF